jgi:hypothetical protein
LPRQLLEFPVHAPGILLRELRDRPNTEHVKIAQHRRPNGNEIAEVSVNNGHGGPFDNSLFIRQ